ncbi:MAG: sugar transport system permease protein [Microbacteriaceae bacterium]|nr:sugar transport system permease protein [Microbacteriaceae bacterium]
MTSARIDAATTRETSSSGGLWVRRHANEVGLVGAIVILYVVLAPLAPNFLSSANQFNILRDAAFVGIIAWGMTLVLIAGEIDISVGANAAFSGVVLAMMITQGVPIVLACILVILLGTLIGLGAGALRALFDIPSFIVTLALWLGLRGLAEVMSSAVPVVIPDLGFQNLGGGNVGGLPNPAIFMVILLVIFIFVSRKTVFGRSVYAVGGNAEAAKLSGIPVPLIRMGVFAITGCLASFAGVLFASRLGSGNSEAASGLEFDVIAAVVVGGTSLFGGRGSMIGTLLGVLFIAALGNGLVLMGVDPFMQNVVRGIVILVAVFVNIVSTKRLARAR